MCMTVCAMAVSLAEPLLHRGASGLAVGREPIAPELLLPAPRLGYGTVMHHATPLHGAPRHAWGDHATPHRVAPCHSMWDHAMPCYVTPRGTTPAGTVPHHVAPRHAMRDHATPHHVAHAQSTGHVASAGIYHPSCQVSQQQAHPHSHRLCSLPRPWAGLLAVGTNVLLFQPTVTLVPGRLCGDSPSEELMVGSGLFPTCQGFLPLTIPRGLEVHQVMVTGDFAGSGDI